MGELLRDMVTGVGGFFVSEVYLVGLGAGGEIYLSHWGRIFC